jgi:hypothetical protein
LTTESLTIVNNYGRCPRVDRLRDVMSSLICKGSFRAYVLAKFAVNRVAAMPILYRWKEAGNV